MKSIWPMHRHKDHSICPTSTMLNISYYTSNMELKPHDRKGIAKRMIERVSDFERGIMWKIWAHTEEYKERSPRGLYTHLVNFNMCEHDAAIKNDVNRTFPNHSVFNESNYTQQILFNVLRAYAMYNPDVGYCQGMAFIAGMLVIYMDEEDAFYTMISVMEKHDINKFFLPQMKHLEKYCHVLDLYLNRKMSQLYLHLQRNNVNTKIIASQWFLTLFTYSFSVETAAILWDAILAMEDNYVLSIALAIFKLLEGILINAKQDELQDILKDLTPYVSARVILRHIDKQKYQKETTKLFKHYYQK